MHLQTKHDFVIHATGENIDENKCIYALHIV